MWRIRAWALGEWWRVEGASTLHLSARGRGDAHPSTMQLGLAGVERGQTALPRNTELGKGDREGDRLSGCEGEWVWSHPHQAPSQVMTCSLWSVNSLSPQCSGFIHHTPSGDLDGLAYWWIDWFDLLIVEDFKVQSGIWHHHAQQGNFLLTEIDNNINLSRLPLLASIQYVSMPQGRAQIVRYEFCFCWFLHAWSCPAEHAMIFLNLRLKMYTFLKNTMR